MISDRLKGIIYKKLCGDLSRVEIIHYRTYVWFIDREDKCWYLRYDNSDGQLLWKYSFFCDFFTIFTMDRDEFTPIISSWVEDVLNCRVNTTGVGIVSKKERVEEVLNCKVDTTATRHQRLYCLVEEVLNCKVITTGSSLLELGGKVEEVLNHKVNSTTHMYTNGEIQSGEVLNHNVVNNV